MEEQSLDLFGHVILLTLQRHDCSLTFHVSFPNFAVFSFPSFLVFLNFPFDLASLPVDAL